MHLKKEKVQSLREILEVPAVRDWYNRMKKEGYFCLVIRFPDEKDTLKRFFEGNRESFYDRCVNVFLFEAFPFVLDEILKQKKFIEKLAVFFVSSDFHFLCKLELSEFPVFFMRYCEAFLEAFYSFVNEKESKSAGVSSSGDISRNEGVSTGEGFTEEKIQKVCFDVKSDFVEKIKKKKVQGVEVKIYLDNF